MSIKKKAMSLILALALCVTAAVTLSGCGSDTAVAMRVGDTEIAAGVYIDSMLVAYSEANTKFKEENPDVDTTAEGFSLLNQTIEGLSAEEWIKDKTVKECCRIVAVEELYAELGLSFTAEEKASQSDYINSTWDTENQMLQYYGINFTTMGAYYESLGIGKASFKRAYLAGLKETAIFNKYYADGGLEAVTKEEIDAYAQENYAVARYFKIALTDGTGATVSTEEGLQVLKDLGNSYVDDMAAGATMAEVKAKYDQYVAEQTIYADMKAAEEAGTEYTGTKIEDVNVATGTDDELEKLIKKDSASPSEAFVTKLFATSADKPVFFEDEGAYYVMMNCSQTDNYDHITDATSDILHALKDDEFDAKILERANTLVISTVAKSVERYSPKVVCGN